MSPRKESRGIAVGKREIKFIAHPFVTPGLG
jgi:hypothetical protein